RARRCRDADRERAVVRRNAGGDALGGFDGVGEVGAVARAVFAHHRLQAEPRRVRAGERHADQAAAVGGEEIYLLRGDEIRGKDEVALVLAVLVVDQHDDIAGAQIGNDLGSGTDGSFFAPHGPIICPRAWNYSLASASSISPRSPIFSLMRAPLPERWRR